ncbi:type II secretion system protein [Roseateles asaccharophilus]|uniref:General secretion pathway protein G n=1 Tax=Roseateles asaccharophilus TaxID=582607 RepID=A0ABU2ADX0_9BURK|nr:type II secretion system protein [Roseateles asaccharophilus]MDR7335401.1 general secretion pathway protein G [Roseateles asaccharophilus]
MIASRPSSEAGFTLIEMMVVCAMLSVLAFAALPMAEVATARWKERELRAALLEIRAGLDAYKRAFDEMNPVRQPGVSGYPPSLDALEQGLLDSRDGGAPRQIRFLRQLPRDPFAPEGLTAQQSWALRAYDSPAHAPRAGADVYDVHSKSERVGTNGIPLKHW